MDQLQRFSFLHAPIRGQWVRLDSVLDEVFANHEYPEKLQNLLAEMLAAVAMIADGIKFKGAVSLQSRGDGVLASSVAECRNRHQLRAMARLREGKGQPIGGLPDMLGNGTLAITLLPESETGADSQPYQGLVSLSGANLGQNLNSYFENSEQLPTRFLLAAGSGSATGLMLQRLPDPDDASEIVQDLNSRSWDTISRSIGRINTRDLAALSVENVLEQTFPGHAISMHPPSDMRFACTCSAAKTRQTLLALPPEEVLEIARSEGGIDVTCEFCRTAYEYSISEVHAMLGVDAPRLH